MIQVRSKEFIGTFGCVVVAVSLAACGGGGDGGESAAHAAACTAVRSELGMPFEYVSSPTEIRIASAGGGNRHLVFGPWGAHASPHTGHAPGNGKADMMAVLANGASAMTTLAGAPCVAYDEQNPNCGLPQSAALAARPVYVLPNRFSDATLALMEEQDIGYEITSVFVKRHGVPGSDDWFYWDSPDQWEVAVRICGQSYALGHLGSISAELRQALVERGVDVTFDAYDGALDVNLVGDEPITTLPPGTAMGYPQLPGKPVPVGPGQDVAYAIPHSGSHVLWAQVEFNTIRENPEDSHSSFIARVYDLLDAPEYAQWESILHLEMDDPTSARYGSDFAKSRQWLWRAEGTLNHTPEFQPESTENGLLRRLGDWWESYEGCGVADVKCNEVISFNRIDRTSPAFEPSYYDANSQYLIWWLRTGGTPQDGYYGEILSTTGDLLADETGSFLVRWRTFEEGKPIDGSLGTQAHQHIAWRRGLDDSLVLAWGTSAAVQGDAVPVAVPAVDAVCNGTTVTCHTGFNANVRPTNIDGQL